MKEYQKRFKLTEERNELFKQINQLFKKHGFDNAEVTGLKVKLNMNAYNLTCPPNKTKYCWWDENGTYRCRCV